jgi:hypothetical protein
MSRIIKTQMLCKQHLCLNNMNKHSTSMFEQYGYDIHV